MQLGILYLIIWGHFITVIESSSRKIVWLRKYENKTDYKIVNVLTGEISNRYVLHIHSRAYLSLCFSYPASRAAPTDSGHPGKQELLFSCSELCPHLFVLFYFILFLNIGTGSHHVAQAGLELLSSSSPPALASHSAGIIGMSTMDWPSLSFF